MVKAARTSIERTGNNEQSCGSNMNEVNAVDRFSVSLYSYPAKVLSAPAHT